MTLGTMYFFFSRTILATVWTFISSKALPFCVSEKSLVLRPKQTQFKLPIIFLRKSQNHVIYNVRSNIDNGFLGEVTEWLKVLAWNAGVVKATEGSNPSLTAIVRWTSWATNILNDGRVPVTVDP